MPFLPIRSRKEFRKGRWPDGTRVVYGMYRTVSGREVLYDRDYASIAERGPGIEPRETDPKEWIRPLWQQMNFRDVVPNHEYAPDTLFQQMADIYEAFMRGEPLDHLAVFFCDFRERNAWGPRGFRIEHGVRIDKKEGGAAA
jgi:hypothetical protein